MLVSSNSVQFFWVFCSYVSYSECFFELISLASSLNISLVTFVHYIFLFAFAHMPNLSFTSDVFQDDEFYSPISSFSSENFGCKLWDLNKIDSIFETQERKYVKTCHKPCQFHYNCVHFVFITVRLYSVFVFSALFNFQLNWEFTVLLFSGPYFSSVLFFNIFYFSDHNEDYLTGFYWETIFIGKKRFPLTTIVLKKWR